MGVTALVDALLVYGIPKLLFVPTKSPQAEQKNQSVYHLQLFLSVLVLVNVAGDLGLYQLYTVGIPYDKFVHFCIPYLAMIFLPLLFQRRFFLSKFQSLWMTLVIIFSASIFWEAFEYFSDITFDTNIFGVYGKAIPEDTAKDLLFGLFGTLIGLFTSLLMPKSNIQKNQS